MDSRAGRRLAPKPAAEDEARRVKDTAAGKRSNHGISSYGVELRRFVPEISERILYASVQNGMHLCIAIGKDIPVSGAI